VSSQAGDDPFGALWLDRAIAEVKRDRSGNYPCPSRRTSPKTYPYERGEDIEVVWLGTIYTRNERDLFEFNQAKGAELDMSDPKASAAERQAHQGPAPRQVGRHGGHDESSRWACA
jgi:hypothetical protein